MASYANLTLPSGETIRVKILAEHHNGDRWVSNTRYLGARGKIVHHSELAAISPDPTPQPQRP